MSDTPSTQQELFHLAHRRIFGVHLGDVKAYSELLRHHWWPKMRSDITHWGRSLHGQQKVTNMLLFLWTILLNGQKCL